MSGKIGDQPAAPASPKRRRAGRAAICRLHEMLLWQYRYANTWSRVGSDPYGGQRGRTHSGARQWQSRRKKRMAKNSPGEFVRQVRQEANKIVWPTPRETLMTSIMVLIFTVILAVFFLGIDTLFGMTVTWLLSLAA
jgi:preprotein translocase subunit SecE